jgi:hypothetical protein
MQATLHSTYAINAGKGYSPVPAAPAPLGDVPISHQLSLTCKPVHDHLIGSDFDVEPVSGSNYYNWPSSYGSELNYAQGANYDSSTNVASYNETPDTYYPNSTGGSPY